MDISVNPGPTSPLFNQLNYVPDQLKSHDQSTVVRYSRCELMKLRPIAKSIKKYNQVYSINLKYMAFYAIEASVLVNVDIKSKLSSQTDLKWILKHRDLMLIQTVFIKPNSHQALCKLQWSLWSQWNCHKKPFEFSCSQERPTKTPNNSIVYGDKRSIDS